MRVHMGLFMCGYKSTTVYRWRYKERKQVGVCFSPPPPPMYTQGTKLRSSGSVTNSFAC